MTNLLEIYKCEKCGNIVEVLHTGVGELVCCGEPMKLYKEKITDPTLGEKHVPVIEKTANGYKVKVGSVAHPMVDVHYIEWVQLLADGRACRRFFKPGDAPEFEFCVKAEKVSAREYCNVHGLWKKEGLK
ncbi:MAG: desulfoferrodoxin [Candidatus Coatesbacteria bacterium]|nr:desulfoferrodoxin [Candidatus Coatesbacteria bacterium]